MVGARNAEAEPAAAKELAMHSALNFMVCLGGEWWMVLMREVLAHMKSN